VPFFTLLVFQLIENGDAPSSGPIGAPSTLKVTPTTPTLSVAVAVSVTVPLRVPFRLNGGSRLTVGGVVSEELSDAMVTVRPADVAVLPALSRAMARNVWLPLETPVGDQLT
jgi:hypothetical protein